MSGDWALTIEVQQYTEVLLMRAIAALTDRGNTSMQGRDVTARVPWVPAILLILPANRKDSRVLRYCK
jgi:hypothetical protein